MLGLCVCRSNSHMHIMLMYVRPKNTVSPKLSYSCYFPTTRPCLAQLKISRTKVENARSETHTYMDTHSNTQLAQPLGLWSIRLQDLPVHQHKSIYRDKLWRQPLPNTQQEKKEKEKWHLTDWGAMRVAFWPQHQLTLFLQKSSLKLPLSFKKKKTLCFHKQFMTQDNSHKVIW